MDEVTQAGYSEAKQMCIDHLSRNRGDVEQFRELLATGNQRMGQAFYNAMYYKEAKRVAGTLYDPFYANLDQLPHLVAHWDNWFEKYPNG